MARKKAGAAVVPVEATAEESAEKLTRIRLDVNQAEHKELRVMAAEENLSMSQFARLAVKEAIARRRGAG